MKDVEIQDTEVKFMDIKREKVCQSSRKGKLFLTTRYMRVC